MVLLWHSTSHGYLTDVQDNQYSMIIWMTIGGVFPLLCTSDGHLLHWLSQICSIIVKWRPVEFLYALTMYVCIHGYKTGFSWI